MKRRTGQLDFHDVLVPRQPHRWQTVEEIDALGERAAARAVEQHQLGPAHADRATDAAWSALILMGAAEIIRQRQQQDGARA